MQKLMIRPSGAKDTDPLKEVFVLRSWANASGAAVYLFHGTGIYGYMDGSPVKSEADLDLIDSPIQREVAKKWWAARGKALSEEFYARQAEREAERAGDFRARGSVPDTDLDYVMYQTKAGNADWSAPVSWMDRFSVRPDWWGQAREIAFNDMAYRMVTNDTEIPPVPPLSKGGEKRAEGKKLSAGEI